jgi:hypothetical protein
MRAHDKAIPATSCTVCPPKSRHAPPTFYLAVAMRAHPAQKPSRATTPAVPHGMGPAESEGACPQPTIIISCTCGLTCSSVCSPLLPASAMACDHTRSRHSQCLIFFRHRIQFFATIDLSLSESGRNFCRTRKNRPCKLHFYFKYIQV